MPLPRIRRRRPLPTSPLERLEREGNDDFHLLAELGPAEFSADHLLELRQQAQDRLQRFDRMARLNVLFGVTSLGWLGLGGLAYQAQQWTLALGAVLLALALILAFIGGVIWLKLRFESRGELEHTVNSIEAELRRRVARTPSAGRSGQ